MRLALILLVFLEGAHACRFISQQCTLGPGDRVLRCFLGGDAHPGEPPLDRVLAQDFRSEAETSCPSIMVREAIRFEFWLMACAPQAAATTFTKEHTAATAQRIHDIENAELVYRDHYDGSYDTPADYESCSDTNALHQNNFTVKTPLMDTDAARGYIGGVSIRILRSPNVDFTLLPRIQREAKSFRTGGMTCNVIKNGMPKLTLYGLHLDNTECVANAIGLEGLSTALTNFGPDQMAIARYTKLWHDFDPTAARLDYITLESWHPYRHAYPGEHSFAVFSSLFLCPRISHSTANAGRALIACDALNSKKYPPDPIRLSDAGVLELEDGKITESSLAEAFVFNYIIDAHGPDNADDVHPDYVCAPPFTENDELYCESGCVLSLREKHCLSPEGAEVFSAPIDIILWDYQGVVLFGPQWSAPGDHPAITVLVYGNPLSTATKHTADVGSVFLDIPPNTVTRTLPTAGLQLLDCSDFYDVAQDEFGCFNRDMPTCPPRDHSAVWITCAVMGALVVIHHISEKRKEADAAGCLVQEAAIDELRREDQKTKGHHDATRIVAMSILLVVPIIIFSPILLFLYLVAPRYTLYKLWHLIAGKPHQQ